MLPAGIVRTLWENIPKAATRPNCPNIVGKNPQISHNFYNGQGDKSIMRAETPKNTNGAPVVLDMVLLYWADSWVATVVGEVRKTWIVTHLQVAIIHYHSSWNRTFLILN